MKSNLTTEIDGYTYEVGMFGATQGVGIAAKLGNLLGPGLAAGEQEGEAVKVGTRSMAMILANLAAPDVQALVKELLGVVSIKGEDGGPALNVFELHFAGRYGPLAKVCSAVVEHNGFFDLLDAFGKG